VDENRKLLWPQTFVASNISCYIPEITINHLPTEVRESLCYCSRTWQHKGIE